MKQAPLPTQNHEWGFWGTSQRNSYDTALCWDAASRFFMVAYHLTPEEARLLLDARFGRHLADDLSFIEGGPVTADAIFTHLNRRHQNYGWRRHFEKSIREETGKAIEPAAPKTKKEVLAAIAQDHLSIETLEERKSDRHDFHDVSVWGIEAALDAAFEAGKASR